MGQQVNVYRKLKIWPGAIIEGGGGPMYGKTYYVDTYHAKKDDNNPGTDPNYPLKTIQAAMDLVVGDQNDYIYVIDAYDADTTAIEPTGQMWHLIGVQNPQTPWMNLNASSDTEDIITGESAGLSYSEIAGIGFGGGATVKGGIYLAQTVGLWVHNCSFGHSFCGDTPDYGIHGGSQNHENCLVEDSYFMGSGGNSQGKIAVDGIKLLGATPSKNFIIRNNIFMGIPGIAISVNFLGGMILNNVFACDADTTGAAITLGTGALGCFVNGNSANFGDTNAMGNKPYVDSATGGADQNTWGLNYQGGTAAYPS